MNVLVSVIVPVYNVENYLRECVDSILRQTYKSIEIILVDDGSSDSSGLICDKYKEKDNRIKVIHKENGGLSDARNSGFRISKGEFITFIDSDDIVSDDFIETMIKALTVDCEVVVSGLTKFTYIIPKFDRNQSVEIQKLSNEEALKILCNMTKFGNSACAKLYKRQLIEKYPYPKGKLYEDLATTYKIIGEAKGIIYCSKKGYFYRQRIGSIRNHFHIEERDWDILEAASLQLNYICEHYPRAVPAAEGRCVVAGFELLRQIRRKTKENTESFKRIQLFIEPFKKDVLTSRDVNIKCKIKCLSICLGYSPAITCSKLFDFMRKTVRR